MYTTRYSSIHKVFGLIILTSFLLPCTSAFTCTNNMTLISELKSVLNSYHFTVPYTIGEFDCVESSYIVQTRLQEHGYDAYVMYRIVSTSSDEESHAWVVVQDGLGAYAVIETTIWAFGVNAIGGVVIPEDVVAYKMNTGQMTKEPKEFLKGIGLGERLDRDIVGWVVNNS
jgi:ribosomal protein S16